MTTDEQTEHFRQWLRRFFKPHTRLAPTAISRKAGMGTSVLQGFLIEGGPSQRGLPRARTLAAIVPVLRTELQDQGYGNLARQCTTIRFLIEAGYLTRDDVLAYVEHEPPPGWIPIEHYLDGVALSLLTEQSRHSLLDFYRFLLHQDRPGTTQKPEADSDFEQARELAR